MTKYKVSGLVMGTLSGLRENKNLYDTVFNLLYIIDDNMTFLNDWIYSEAPDNTQNRQREQAVIDYVFNGADNFEVKTPTWVIVSKKADRDLVWLCLYKNIADRCWSYEYAGDQEDAEQRATRITDPKLKDALLYANKDFEAIEVEE